MKTKGTMRLKVVQVYEGSEPMTIGSGYMVLTADDKSNLYYQFEKFSVGDEVLLETSFVQCGAGKRSVGYGSGQCDRKERCDDVLFRLGQRAAL